jgi:GDP-4-dehydro-6-deoxy-D-mannose reductase
VAEIQKGRRQPVLEVGNLQTARDFIHVDDAVRCYWKLVNQPAAFGEIVNVSSGAALPIKRLLDTLIELSGQDVSVVSRAERIKAHDTPSFYASGDKLRALVGETLEFPIEKTLREVLEYELAQP